MAAKSATERKREQRERDKLAEEERLARLLSRKIKIDLYKATDAALLRIMARTGIEEEQDIITRLIHCADLLDDAWLAEITSLSRRAVT
jgi:hypothetical protein